MPHTNPLIQQGLPPSLLGLSIDFITILFGLNDSHYIKKIPYVKGIHNDIPNGQKTAAL